MRLIDGAAHGEEALELAHDTDLGVAPAENAFNEDDLLGPKPYADPAAQDGAQVSLVCNSVARFPDRFAAVQFVQE